MLLVSIGGPVVVLDQEKAFLPRDSLLCVTKLKRKSSCYNCHKQLGEIIWSSLKTRIACSEQLKSCRSCNHLYWKYSAVSRAETPLISTRGEQRPIYFMHNCWFSSKLFSGRENSLEKCGRLHCAAQWFEEVAGRSLGMQRQTDCK